MLLYSSRGWRLTLLALTALYAALIALQAGRFLWFDELLTYFIARAPDLNQVLASVKQWDLNPPLLHVLAHASLWIKGGEPVAVRFPSIVEFYFASFLLFWYSFRKLGSAFAAFPVLVLWYSPIFQYATEARPYALLCLFFCALLLLWHFAITDRNRRLALAGIAISSIGLLSSHLVAPLSLLPFFAAEAVRALDRKKTDYPLWAALFLPLALITFYLPFYKSYKTITYYPFAFQASLGKAVSFYWHTLSEALFCFAVAVLAAWLLGGRRTLGALHPRLCRFEYVFFGAIAVVPLLLDMVMMLDMAPFWGRYAITSALALYLLGSVMVAALFRENSRAGHVCVEAAFALLVIQRVIVPWHSAREHPVPVTVAAFTEIRPNLPVVAASGLTFIEMGHYEKPQVVSRLFYLRDRSAAIEFAHATMFEDLEDFRKAFNLPGAIEPYGKFIHEHRDFLVFGTFNYPEDWLLRKLAADGATITRLGSYETPYKDKTLYEVRIIDGLPGLLPLHKTPTAPLLRGSHINFAASGPTFSSRSRAESCGS